MGQQQQQYGPGHFNHPQMQAPPMQVGPRIPQQQPVPRAPNERRGTGKEALETMLKARHPPPQQQPQQIPQQFIHPNQGNMGPNQAGHMQFQPRPGNMMPNQRAMRPMGQQGPPQGVMQQQMGQIQQPTGPQMNQVRMGMQGNQQMYQMNQMQIQQQHPQQQVQGGYGGHPQNVGYQAQMQMQDNNMHGMEQQPVMNQGYIPQQQQLPQQMRGMRPQQPQQFMQRYVNCNSFHLKY